MTKLKYAAIPIIILSIIGLAIFYSGLPLSASSYPYGPNIGPGDRVLVVAPHPDDETIGTGGLIKNCTENNIPVKVVVITDGDSYRSQADVRHNETRNATQLLGLKPGDITFLGYPDGGLYNLFNINWDSENHYTKSNGASQITYPFVQKPNRVISGENLEKDLEDSITSFQPTIIIGPDGEDQQTDHKATQEFLEYSTHKINYTGKKYNYLVHLPPSWPNPRSYYPEYFLLPPSELQKDSNWVVFPMNSNQEQIKEGALKSYASQVPPTSYLYSFIRKNELFSQYTSLELKLNTANTTSNTTPNLVINDTVQEDNAQVAYPSMDLKSVGLSMEPEWLWVFITTKDPIKKEDFFTLHLIGMDKEANRMDLQIHQDKVEVLPTSKNNKDPGSPLSLNVEGNLILLKIPSNAFQNSQVLLVSVETSNGQRIVDQTRMNTIKIIK